jgi:DNA-binding response OmpR family regulator
MEKRRRALLLDTDPDTLITLQHVLEEADIDATVPWDEMEACQLIEGTPFDLILVGDHPPELNAAVILDDLSLRGTCPPVLIFRGIFGEKDAEYFRRLGAIGVVPKRDALAVLEQVTRVLAPVQLKANAAKACLNPARAWQAASWSLRGAAEVGMRRLCSSCNRTMTVTAEKGMLQVVPLPVTGIAVRSAS